MSHSHRRLEADAPLLGDIETEAERLHAVVAGVLREAGSMLDDDERDELETLRDALATVAGIDGGRSMADADAHQDVFL